MVCEVRGLKAATIDDALQKGRVAGAEPACTLHTANLPEGGFTPTEKFGEALRGGGATMQRRTMISVEQRAVAERLQHHRQLGIHRESQVWLRVDRHERFAAHDHLADPPQ